MPEATELQSDSKKLFVLYQDAYKELAQSIGALVDRSVSCELGKIEELAAMELALFNEVTHLAMLADEEYFPTLLPIALSSALSLAILPTPANRRLCNLFAIPKDMGEALKLALSDTPQKIDQLYCNGTPVMCGVTIAHVPFASTHNCGYMLSIMERAKLLGREIKEFFTLQPLIIEVETSKGEAFTTAVSGVAVIEHDTSALAARLTNSGLSSQDGKISALFAAPDSMVSYLGFLWRFFTSDVTQSGKLPPCTGFIKSSELKIRTAKPVKALMDGKRFEADAFSFVLQPKAIRINCGEAYAVRHMSQSEEKDSYKTEKLPKGEHVLAVLKERLPFFSHASEESFADLFVQLRRNSTLQWSFFILMFLSSMIASLGMLLNSASVVIGAMILAPLMGPIIAFSMGLMRNDTALTVGGMKMIFGGVTLALGVAALVAYMIPVDVMTSEIQGRLTPNLLDLGIAVMAGIAGAYAQAKEDIAATLPGVAIAVALVPPLCVAGIGMGWGDLMIIKGAMLLFVTNLVGISLAASLTFLLLGYAPFLRATKGIVLSSILTAAVTVPLYFAYTEMQNKLSVEKALTQELFILSRQPVKVENASTVYERRGELEIHADVLCDTPLNSDEMGELKQQIEARLGMPVLLNMAIRIRR